MESYCNNPSAMDYRRNYMRSSDHHYNGCNQRMNNRQQMMQTTLNDNMKMCCDKEERNITDVEIVCDCQVTEKTDCYRMDKMEGLGCEFPVVMSYVPWQQWGELYDAECGLKQGTVFKDLNFVFCGERC